MADFDLPKLSIEQLRNLHGNAKRLGRHEVALAVLQELTLRGGAKSSDYAWLTWNQDSAKRALGPFVEVAKMVRDNRRTTYTEAGGRKIGRGRSDPEWMWVDSYTAIKTAKLNAVFVCYVPKPGDDAYFELHLDGEVVRRFEPSELGEALEHWRMLETSARGDGPQ